jgi:predicted ATP-binding protein involved in virulence
MHLASVRLCNLGTGDLVLRLGNPPRRLTVVFGAGGMGKTTLLSAIASPETLEPMFLHAGETVGVDDLPKGARHLTAITALTLRALFGAYEAETSPREREGVVLVDDLELQQDGAIQRHLVPLLCKTLPRVQWIVTTASPEIASGCDPDQLVALRRMAASESVELHEGPLALIH